MTLPPLVEYEVFRDYLGVAAGDVLEADTYRLLDAICTQVRRITRRDYEGDEGGSYSQTIRIRGAREFTLPHVPVRSITSINRVYFDGTEDDAYDATEWRLEDADRGRVHLHAGAGSSARARLEWPDQTGRGPEYVRVVWTTTGDLEADVPQAVLDWGKAAWDDRERNPALASYETGDDAESYFATLAGKPPVSVTRTLMGVRHARGGGVV
jgi:hypothetical protein